MASKNSLEDSPKNLEILGFILLEDVIRENAKKTLDYFKKEGVMVKIISGDNSKTVLNIAKKVGLGNIKGIDVMGLSEEELKEAVFQYQAFGRVSPEQKKLMVETLQKSGRTVAMTGDGVNDVLALKKSDCAISIASGSDAARNVSQLILLDNNFESCLNYKIEQSYRKPQEFLEKYFNNEIDNIKIEELKQRIYSLYYEI